MLKKITDSVYTLDKELPKNPIGRRMIVIKYGDNKLALHSAIALEGSEKCQAVRYSLFDCLLYIIL